MANGGSRLSHKERKTAAQLARAPTEDLTEAERVLVKLFLAEQVARHVDGVSAAARSLVDLERADWERLKNKPRRSAEP